MVAVRLEKIQRDFYFYFFPGVGVDSQATFDELVCLLHGKQKKGFGH